MKKHTLIVSSLFFVTTSFAQEKAFFDKLFLMYSQKKIQEVKIEVDKMAANPANTSIADVWAWKTTMDAEMIADDALKTKCTDCMTTSFDAFKKYETLDPEFKLMTEAPLTWRSLGILYDKYYDIGRVAYQAKEWEKAFENFEKCAYFSKIITKKDLKKNGGALDTLPILMCAYSAQNAQKVKEALAYYTIAANTNYGGDADIEMYKYLLVGYSDLKDKNSFNKYLTQAKTKYPKETFEDYQLDYLLKNATLDEKLEAYKTFDAAGTLSNNGYSGFGDMLISVSKAEREILEKDLSKKTMFRSMGREAYKKSFEKTASGTLAFNVGILYYNDYNDLDDAQRNNIKLMQELNANKKGPGDAKTKAQIDVYKKENANFELKIMEVSNFAIEWLEKSIVILKDKTDKSKVEKNSFKSGINALSNLCAYRKDKSRGKDLKAYDAFDAKFKLYEEMYNKLN